MEVVSKTIKGMNVDFYPDSHTYYVDGVECISTTQIATYLNPFRKMKIPEHILRKAGLKGTVVHEAIEHHIETGEVIIDALCIKYNVNPPNAMPYFEAYLKLREFYGDRLKIIHMEEKAIYVHEVNGVKIIIVGTIDIIAELDGVLCIIDWKTSSAMTLPEWRMQLSIYKRLVQYTFDMECDKRYIAWLKKNGTFEMVEIAPLSDSWLNMIFDMLHPKVRPIIDRFNLLLHGVYGEDMIK